MSRIFGVYTCTRVKWECGDERCEHDGCVDYPIEEHGWIDRNWSATELFEHRNDVSPIVSLDESDPDLMEEVREALGWLEGGFEDNGDGTFYARESYQPLTEPWHYSYALHFVRKFHGPKGWTEERWIPDLSA